MDSKEIKHINFDETVARIKLVRSCIRLREERMNAMTSELEKVREMKKIKRLKALVLYLSKKIYFHGLPLKAQVRKVA